MKLSLGSSIAWLLASLLAGLSLYLAVAIHLFAALPTTLFLLLLLYLFRDPVREVPPRPLAIVSPIDGEVVDIETVEAPHLKRQTQKISLTPNRFGPYTIRSPMEAKVMHLEFEPTHCVSLCFCSDEGDEMEIAIRPQYQGRIPHCSVGPGERVGQGARCAFLLFGAQVTLYLPENSRIEVAKGDRLRAGSDILATLIRR